MLDASWSHFFNMSEAYLCTVRVSKINMKYTSTFVSCFLNVEQEKHINSEPSAISCFRHLMSFSVLWTRCNDKFLFSFIHGPHPLQEHPLKLCDRISVKIWYPKCTACRSDLIYIRFFIWKNSYYPSLHWNQMGLNSGCS